MTTYQNVKPITIEAGDCLAVIQRALVDLGARGVNVRVSSLYERGDRSVVIVLAGVEIRDGNLIIAEAR